MAAPALAPEQILSGLKEFQRRTVEHAFRRMYLDERPTPRFLVADEVGLGKTLVARGIIAKAVDHLTRNTDVRRIDVVYICSNAAIARQNINRLNVFKDTDLTLATRLTLLPIQMRELRRRARGQGKKVNLVSFTPATTFELKSRGGRREERLVLYFLLREMKGLDPRGLKKALRGGVTRRNWARHVRSWDETIDRRLARDFRRTLREDRPLLGRLRHVCAEYRGLRGRTPRPLNRERLDVTGELRELLARVCANALEPDLIILDEFQRFRELLEVQDPSEAAELARSLMGYRDETAGLDARVLLLSATPYRMLTLQHEEGDDHYEDFVRTLRFLFEGSGVDVSEIEEDFLRLRRGLFSVGVKADEAAAVRRRIEKRLRLVMARTERVGATIERDAMVTEPPVASPVLPEDLRAARATGRLAEAVGAGETVEYWKSAPYLMNLMRDYELKRKLAERSRRPGRHLSAAVRAAQAAGIRGATVEAYERLDPGNARLRALFRDTLDAGQWRWLWMPPSLPYWTPGGGYAGDSAAATKSLVFSSWNVVPDAISALASYEAERRMLERDGEPPEYALLNERRSPLLQFKVEEGRPGGMTTLALFYPSVTLARTVDPLSLAVEAAEGGPLDSEGLRARARDRLAPLLRGLPQRTSEDRRADLTWYWAAPALLDAEQAPTAIDWCRDPKNGWRTVGEEEEGDRGDRFAEHVDRFVATAAGEERPGRAPDDLLDALVDLALAGPGPCALRSLARIFPSRRLDDPALLKGAALVAEGLRSLFNQPAAAALVRRDRYHTPYWRLVLEHGLEGNLQAVLDEYLHVLRDSLGLVGHEQKDEAIAQISKAAFAALSLRTSRVKVDEYTVLPARIQAESFNLRTHFALRFGDMKDDSGATVVRAGAVREAFNSPFRPFVLASTSVGQEGLDFHSYCHVLYHWNLPSNPVDLEQREGRIHRYKGHAVRKNVAAAFGLRGLADGWDRRSDPWDHLFARAAASVPDRAGDLIPFWIYEHPGGPRVERRVPMLPLSRERAQLARLKRGLAVYRMVFGQPRQQELLEYLAQGNAEEAARGLQVSLAP